MPLSSHIAFPITYAVFLYLTRAESLWPNSPVFFFYSHLKRIPIPPNTGGQKVIRQHIQVLLREGFDAYQVVSGWFPLHPDLPVVTFWRLKQIIRPDDYLVVPTIYAGQVADLPGEREVLLNQNGPLMLSKISTDTSVYPWERDDVVAAICTSSYDVDLMEMLGADISIHRVYDRVDTSGVEPLPWTEREEVICTPPLTGRKNRWHCLMLGHLARSNIRNVRIVEIQGMRSPEAMETLSRAKVFLFPSVNEGFGLLPLEAASLRVPVIAYRNQLYGEFLPGACLFAPGDIRSAWEAIRHAFREPDTWEAPLNQAAQNARTYSLEQQRDSVLRVWDEITTGH